MRIIVKYYLGLSCNEDQLNKITTEGDLINVMKEVNIYTHWSVVRSTYIHWNSDSSGAPYVLASNDRGYFLEPDAKSLCNGQKKSGRAPLCFCDGASSSGSLPGNVFDDGDNNDGVFDEPNLIWLSPKYVKFIGFVLLAPLLIGCAFCAWKLSANANKKKYSAVSFESDSENDCLANGKM